MLMKRLLAILFPVFLFAQTPYQKPPKAIEDVLNAPTPPNVSVSPTRDYAILTESVRYPTIAELSEPMLRLAGHRINPKTNGQHMEPRVVSITVKKLADGTETKVALPPSARVSPPSWSPDGKHFAFANPTSRGIQLWVGITATGAVRQITGVRLNETMTGGGGGGGGGGFGASNRAFRWLPGSRQLVVRTVPTGRGPAPAADAPPSGPNIQENMGKAGPVPTYEDLLKGVQDEKLFDYYFTAQLGIVDLTGGTITPIGKPAIFEAVDPSPDGKHILVASLHKPFSYQYPSNHFPKEAEVWDRSGKVEYKVASLPLADSLPLDGVDRKSTRLNSSHIQKSRMPSSA